MTKPEDITVATDINQAPTVNDVSENVVKVVSKEEEALEEFKNFGVKKEEVVEVKEPVKVADTTEANPTEPAKVEPVKTYSQEEVDNMKREAEKEAKRKYISQVSLKDKELKDTQANYEKIIKSLEGKEDGVSIKDAIEARFLADKAEMELKSEMILERENFYKSNADVAGDKEFENMLSELRTAIPNVTLDMAKKIYMAERPEKFFKSVQAPMMTMGSAPVVVKDKAPTPEELRQEALSAFNKLR